MKLLLTTFVLPLNFLLAMASLNSTATAGDVQVKTARNNIVVSGTTQDDIICLFEGANGNIIIEGFSGTTLNGLIILDTGVNLSFANNISFDMRGGDDSIEVNFIEDNPGPEGILGNFFMKMGPGEDDARLELGDVGGDVDIVMNGGDDFLVFRSTTVAGNVTYLPGAGSDTGFVGRDFQSEAVDVMGDFVTRCAGGNDETYYITGTVLGKLSHSDGGGADLMSYEDFMVLNGMDYFGGGGQDLGTFRGGFSFTGPTVSIVEGDLNIRGGGGNDVLDFGVNNSASCENISYLGGSGRDTVNAGDFATLQGTISVSLGQGNDALNYSEFVEFAFPGVLNGGADVDSIQPSAAELEKVGFTVISFEK